jgi:hypothetical protein
MADHPRQVVGMVNAMVREAAGDCPVACYVRRAQAPSAFGRLGEDHYQIALALAGAKSEEMMTISRLRRNPDPSKNR